MGLYYLMFCISAGLYIMIIITLIRLNTYENIIIKRKNLHFIIGVISIFSGIIIMNSLTIYQWARIKITVEADIYFFSNLFFIIGETMILFGVAQYIKDQSKRRTRIEKLYEKGEQGYNIVVDNDLRIRLQHTESIFHYEVNKRSLHINNRTLELIGYTSEDIDYRRFINCIDKESRTTITDFVAKANKACSMNIVINVTKMNGNRITLAVMANKETIGGKEYITGTSRDITDVADVTEGNKELILKNATLNSLFNYSDLFSLFVLDHSYNYLTADNNHKNFLKKYFDLDFFIGMNMLEVVRKYQYNDFEYLKEGFDRALSGEKSTGTKDTFIKGNGTKFFLHEFVPVKDKKDRIIGVLTVVVNVTENENVKRELLEAKEEAVLANMAKSRFLASMSHEIRTPMNGIMGLTDILLQSELNEKQRMFMETIKKSANSLLEIINDILDLSKIESGKIELNKEVFDLHDLINNLKRIFYIKEKRKNLDIKYEIGDNIPTLMLGDTLRLKQILINLIGNAIKFTPKGTVIVRVATVDRNVVSESDKHIKLRFEVEDTGIGISKEHHKDIFQSFKQVEKTYQRKYNGTGLGLAITKQLVEIMGGAIDVKSKVNEGSIFTFEIPFVVIDATPYNEREAAAARLGETKMIIKERNNCTENSARDILVAEDNSVNQMLIRELITMNGWNYKVVENGEEVIDALKEKTYDLILMDISMPIMDGITATKIIRNEPRWRDIPIVALTAYALVTDRENFISKGLDDYLSKPLDQKEFYSVVSKYLSLNIEIRSESKNQDSRDVYNFKKLEELLDGDIRLIVELGEKVIQMFSETERIKIENLIKGNELLELKEYIHKAKGAVSNFQLSDVQNCLKELYESASCGKVVEAISKIDEISRKIKEFEEKLNIYSCKGQFLQKNDI